MGTSDQGRVTGRSTGHGLRRAVWKFIDVHGGPGGESAHENTDYRAHDADRVVKEIDQAPNRVRYTMNGFVIAVGSYVKPLLKHAKAAAKKLGTVSVNMGDTACKVPNAKEYIQKVETAGRVGKKRKTTKC